MISIVIPVYKKTEEFVKNLESNLPYMKGCEVIIVNDNPEKSIKADVSIFKQLKLIENSGNLGFAGAANAGMRAATGEYIFLMNSDVLLLDSSFKNAVKYFEDNPKLFSVGFAQKEKNGKIVGKNRFFWKNGMFQHKHADSTQSGISAWAEGGSSLFSSEKLKELKYFDEMYAPFYWEDIDLSYRAWKRGFEVWFASEIVVEHHHESTIGSYFSKAKVKRIAYRNQLLFIWKNITQPHLRVSHAVHILWIFVKMLLKGEFAFIMGYIDAIGRFQMYRKPKNKTVVLTDAEILKKLS